MQTVNRGRHDVVIVGGRVAGSATAMLLARLGHDVAVVDQANSLAQPITNDTVAESGRPWACHQRPARPMTMTPAPDLSDATPARPAWSATAVTGSPPSVACATSEADFQQTLTWQLRVCISDQFSSRDTIVAMASGSGGAHGGDNHHAETGRDDLRWLRVQSPPSVAAFGEAPAPS